MEKPTEAQIKEFWEWCGFTQNKQNLGRGSEYLWNYPDTKLGTLPSIDLNNLFKYAVPRVGYVILSNWNKKKKPTASVFDGEGKCCSMESSEDPALALFWAIWEVIR